MFKVSCEQYNFSYIANIDPRIDIEPNVQRTPTPPLRATQKRNVYNEEQVTFLEKEFRQHKYISFEKRKSIAEHLKVSETSVKIWFQNRRAKDRREQSKGPRMRHSTRGRKAIKPLIEEEVQQQSSSTTIVEEPTYPSTSVDSRHLLDQPSTYANVLLEYGEQQQEPTPTVSEEASTRRPDYLFEHPPSPLREEEYNVLTELSTFLNFL